MSYWLEDANGYVGDLASNGGIVQLLDTGPSELRVILEGGGTDQPEMVSAASAACRKIPVMRYIADLLDRSTVPVIVTDGSEPDSVDEGDRARRASLTAAILERVGVRANPNHVPGGSPEGGQFASALSDAQAAYPRAEERPFGADVGKAESAIRTQDHEIAHAWDENGKHLFVLDGKRSSVAFTDAQLAQLHNAVLTHNHPDSPVGDEGSSFSTNDIKLATQQGVAEIRVVGSKGATYLMRRPSAGWPAWGSTKQSGTLASAVSRETSRLTKEARQSGKLQSFIGMTHRMWTTVAPKFGIPYEKVA